MKRFLGFVKKEFLHIMRDVRSLMILLGIPVVQILLFGYVLTNEIKNADIAVLDHSRDETTARIINKISSSDYFQVTRVLNSDREIERALESGEVKMVVVFGQDFGRYFQRTGQANVQLIADASDPNNANLLVSYARAIINDFTLGQVAQTNSPPAIDQKVRMLFNEKLEGVYMFVPGTMALILMLLSAMMTSISIAREKEMGTMEVLLVSPLRPTQIVLGKVMPYVLLAFLNALVIIVLGVTVFGMPVQGSLTLLMLESLLFICLALALGIFISTMADTQMVAMFISMFALMLPTILLSGFIFPISNMPQVLQYLSHIIPAKYFIVILKNVMLKGTGFLYIWQETLVLVLMMTGLIILSIKKFKIRLD